MNKVKLQLEDLQVESFAVEADAAEVGTVHGQAVDAGSGQHSKCWTWCTNCCSENQTNCMGDDSCAQGCYVSFVLSECADANTCYDPGCVTSYYTECTCDFQCATQPPGC